MTNYFGGDSSEESGTVSDTTMVLMNIDSPWD